MESSHIRDQTLVPCIGRQTLIHSTTREVPLAAFKPSFLPPGIISTFLSTYLLLLLLLLLSCLSHVWLWPHGLQHARLPCSSPSPGACSKSYPLSRWCHPTISSSVVPFSSCLQSFPASGSFLMSHLFASGGQSIVASGSASVLPMNTKDWFPLGLTGLISWQSKGLSRDFSNPTVQKHQFFCIQLS